MPEKREDHSDQTDWRKLREQHYQQAAEASPARYHFPHYVKVREAVIGICLAGFCYIVLRFMVFTLDRLFGGVSPAELLCTTFGLFILSVAGVIGLAPIALACLAVTALIARSLAKDPSWPVIAVTAGGLTGFLCTALVFQQVTLFFWEDSLQQVLLGPVLATVFGQLGAAWTAVALVSDDQEDPETSSQVKPLLRFDIRQVLIATAWVAGILTVLKLTDALGGWSLSIATAWFVLQAVSAWLIILAVRKARSL